MTQSTSTAIKGWWYGIGKTPTTQDIENAAKRYAVVVLNAWETAAMRKIKALNPAVKVLVYKCLSSTRSYSGAVDGGKDAKYLPAGLGYVASRPEWFAVDIYGRRIEWDGYPGHWQMAVWDPAYQQAWIAAVGAEVTREGWDGVLADNDMNSLQWYSTVRFGGTATAAATDAKLRDGLTVLLDKARSALSSAGKLFIPNVSESHVRSGRWTAHCGSVGGMEENAAMREDDGRRGVLTFGGTEFSELVTVAAAGTAWLLLSTRVSNARDELTGYATAALLAGPKTCWQGATTGDYRVADWSALQSKNLGMPTTPATRNTLGVWMRGFTGGWVAVNPTTVAVRVTPPSGYVRLDGTAAVAGTLAPGDALVLFTTPTPPSPPRVIGYRYTDPVTGAVSMLDPKDVQVVMG